MAKDARLTQLIRKHQEMVKKIEEAQKQPSFDDVLLRDMKRRKLLIKDQIAKFSPS